MKIRSAILEFKLADGRTGITSFFYAYAANRQKKFVGAVTREIQWNLNPVLMQIPEASWSWNGDVRENHWPYRDSNPGPSGFVFPCQSFTPPATSCRAGAVGQYMAPTVVDSVPFQPNNNNNNNNNNSSAGYDLRTCALCSATYERSSHVESPADRFTLLICVSCIACALSPVAFKFHPWLQPRLQLFSLWTPQRGLHE
jgi:hypothetical protein